MIQGTASNASKQAKVLLKKYLESRGDCKTNGCLAHLYRRTGQLLGITSKELKLPRNILGFIILDWLKCPVFDRVSFLQTRDRKDEYLAEINQLSREKNIRRDNQNDTGVVHGTKVFFDKEFYISDAWRKLRYKAIIKHGNRCMCCGRSPKEGISIHIDHIKPKSLWPNLALNLDNLQILCSDCNIGKGNRDKIKWGKV